jgi:hypothetical protein
MELRPSERMLKEMLEASLCSSCEEDATVFYGIYSFCDRCNEEYLDSVAVDYLMQGGEA